MKLELNTKRALKFEERTGVDLIQLLRQIHDTQTFKLRDIVDLFIACGDDYTVEMFDSWDAPLSDKVNQIIAAIDAYFEAKK